MDPQLSPRNKPRRRKHIKNRDRERLAPRNRLWGERVICRDFYQLLSRCGPALGRGTAALPHSKSDVRAEHHLARKLGRAREEKLTRTEVTTIVDSHEWSRDTCSQVSCLLPPGLLCRCGLRAAEEGSPPPDPAPLPQSGESGLAPLEQLWPFKQPSPDTSSRQQPSLPWVPCQRASLVAQLVKNPSVMQETPVGFPGQEDAPWRRDSRPKARLLARLLKCRDQILFTLFPLSALRILPWTK